MKFAKIVFRIAAVWGVLVLTPLYFMFDLIGRQDPPPITHPAFYYGFVSIGLVWQTAFWMIGQDPVRLRPIMILAVLEKFSFGAVQTVLYLQHRLHGSDLALGCIDMLWGMLFLVAFFRTNPARSATS